MPRLSSIGPVYLLRRLAWAGSGRAEWLGEKNVCPPRQSCRPAVGSKSGKLLLKHLRFRVRLTQHGQNRRHPPNLKRRGTGQLGVSNRETVPVVALCHPGRCLFGFSRNVCSGGEGIDHTSRMYEVGSHVDPPTGVRVARSCPGDRSIACTCRPVFTWNLPDATRTSLLHNRCRLLGARNAWGQFHDADVAEMDLGPF